MSLHAPSASGAVSTLPRAGAHREPPIPSRDPPACHVRAARTHHAAVATPGPEVDMDIFRTGNIVC